MTRFTAGPAADDAELAAYGDLVRRVYNTTDDTVRAAWIERAGRGNVRVVRQGATVVGGLLLLPMGQWFGGRAVPMTGVAAVAVAPEHRSQGAATALMRAAVEEMRASAPLSALYPATQPLYRAVGYERAGCEYRVAVAARDMDVIDRGLCVRLETPADAAAVEALYRRRAAGSAGNLDRGEYAWLRVRAPLVGAATGYVVEGEHGLEGYAYVVTRETSDPLFTLWCNDLLAQTRAAACRLVTFFADHRSMTGEVAWRSSPADPLLAVMREQYAHQAKVWSTWMLRVLDVPEALAARGYPKSLSAEVHFEVADELLPRNAGRWVLRVADGRGVAERGGRGSVLLDVRGLAALYTGFHGAAGLVAGGLASGADDDLAAAAAVFAGPAPWMADHF